MALPATTERVAHATRDDVNAEIERATEERVAWYAEHPDEIETRLEELDREWDVERTLEANASSLALVGLGLGVFVNRKFLLLPAIVGGFLLQHALQGWCPPLPVLRRLGVRTQSEIERERYALKALRGDFRDVADPAHGSPGRSALRAARA